MYSREPEDLNPFLKPLVNELLKRCQNDCFYAKYRSDCTMCCLWHTRRTSWAQWVFKMHSQVTRDFVQLVEFNLSSWTVCLQKIVEHWNLLNEIDMFNVEVQGCYSNLIKNGWLLTTELIDICTSSTTIPRTKITIIEISGAKLLPTLLRQWDVPYST